MKTDIQIANEKKYNNINKVIKELSLNDEDVEYFGKYKAKLSLNLLNKKNKAKLVLCTAINPTKMGEGKTTTTVGLADGLRKINKKSIAVLREPSLGPVFGIKGGATGGGYSQVIPMEDINLHFNGDFHAITSANNLISAMIDNHIFQGNELNIDTNKIIHKRVIDMNDRQLRYITSGLGGAKNGIPHDDGFDITVASEIMAIFCLSNDLNDLKQKIGKMIVAYDKNDKPITVNDIKATGAVCVLLKNAMKPNLVQTLEETPAIIHGGPFANIAHGCNSIIATKMGLKLSDIVVTEAGFGADLGAEKFLDIKCRIANIKPSVVVLVATIRALKLHGNEDYSNLKNKNIEALIKGLPNLIQHINNIKNNYNLPVVVAINKFDTDTEDEISIIKTECQKLNVEVSLCENYEKGGLGAIDLANKVVSILEKDTDDFKFLYDPNDTIHNKILKLSQNIYHANDVEYSDEAQKEIEKLEKLNLDKLPICIAKTQYSFSDDKNLLGAPKGFNIHIKKIKISNGAGFIVAYAGDIMTMPGLPKVPAAESIDIDDNDNIIGLF